MPRSNRRRNSNDSKARRPSVGGGDVAPRHSLLLLPEKRKRRRTDDDSKNDGVVVNANHLVNTAMKDKHKATLAATQITNHINNDHSCNAAEREEILQALADATDLPSCYAALKLAQERLRGSSLSASDQQVMEQARLAVPFLMHQMSVEIFTRPRNLGGLAFSFAKATEIATRKYRSGVLLRICHGAIAEKEGRACGR
jgi:hypothetical protein